MKRHVTLGDHPAMNDSLARLHEVYESLGVKVTRIPSLTTDSVFHRDVSAWTPWGLIKCRMGKPGRVDEPNAWFDAVGIKAAWEIGGDGTFEGADLLWVGPNTAIVATGARTNEEGATVVSEFLKRKGARVHQVRLPDWHDQHLLGVANYAAGRVWSFPDVALPKEYCTHRLPMEEYALKGSNWVAVKKMIVLPSDCDEGARRITMGGACTVSLNVSSLLEHGGGVACATGRLSWAHWSH